MINSPLSLIFGSERGLMNIGNIDSSSFVNLLISVFDSAVSSESERNFNLDY